MKRMNLALVFAVTVMMVAVPVFASSESDATDFSAKDWGISYKSKTLNYEEYEKLEDFKEFYQSLMGYCGLHEVDASRDFSESKNLVVKGMNGHALESNGVITDYYARYIEGDIKIVIDATPVVPGVPVVITKDIEDAEKASKINAYFGTYTDGTKIVLEGKVRSAMTDTDRTTYAKIDDDRAVFVKDVESITMIQYIDLKGTIDGKPFAIFIDRNISFAYTEVCDYSVELDKVAVGTEYTSTFSRPALESKITYTLGDEKVEVVMKDEGFSHTSEDTVESYDIYTVTKINGWVDEKYTPDQVRDFYNFADDYANYATVGCTFADAKSVFNEVGNINNGSGFPIAIVAAIAVIAVAGIGAFVFLKKRKC